MRLRSTVSLESFAVACMYLNGEGITVTSSCAADLKLLGNELKCPSLLELVMEFEKRTTDGNLSLKVLPALC